MCHFVSILVVDYKDVFHIVTGRKLNCHGEIYKKAREKFPNLNLNDVFEVEWQKDYKELIDVRTKDCDGKSLIKATMIRNFLKDQYSSWQDFARDMVRKSIADGDYSFITNDKILIPHDGNKKSILLTNLELIKFFISNLNSGKTKNDLTLLIDELYEFATNLDYVAVDSKEILPILEKLSDIRFSLRDGLMKTAILRVMQYTFSPSSLNGYIVGYKPFIASRGLNTPKFTDGTLEAEYWRLMYRKLVERDMIFDRFVFVPDELNKE